MDKLKNKKISNERIVLSLGIERLYKDFQVKKTINFSNTLERSKQFINDLKEKYLDTELISFKSSSYVFALKYFGLFIFAIEAILSSSVTVNSR